MKETQKIHIGLSNKLLEKQKIWSEKMGLDRTACIKLALEKFLRDI